jgi:hypothetical protein
MQSRRPDRDETTLAPMTEQEFRTVYPLIAGWIRKTLAEHASAARPVASLGFSRLLHYHDEKILASTKVVFVSRVPVPLLSAMGLDRFSDFEQMDAGGITCLAIHFKLRVVSRRSRPASFTFCGSPWCRRGNSVLNHYGFRLCARGPRSGHGMLHESGRENRGPTPEDRGCVKYESMG